LEPLATHVTSLSPSGSAASREAAEEESWSAEERAGVNVRDEDVTPFDDPFSAYFRGMSKKERDGVGGRVEGGNSPMFCFCADTHAVFGALITFIILSLSARVR
jgi:hypothetical protein